MIITESMLIVLSIRYFCAGKKNSRLATVTKIHIRYRHNLKPVAFDATAKISNWISFAVLIGTYHIIKMAYASHHLERNDMAALIKVAIEIVKSMREIKSVILADFWKQFGDQFTV